MRDNEQRRSSARGPWKFGLHYRTASLALPALLRRGLYGCRTDLLEHKVDKLAGYRGALHVFICPQRLSDAVAFLRVDDAIGIIL